MCKTLTAGDVWGNVKLMMPTSGKHGMIRVGQELGELPFVFVL